jgi:hypothetical protein
MAQAKFCKVAGVWKPVSAEFGKVGGAWKTVPTNWAKVTDWKGIPFAKYLFVCEQFSDRLYGLDDTPTDLAGWPKFGGGISDPNDVAVDSDGNSYWACAGGVYKIGVDGTIAPGWPYTGHGTTVLSVCVDADGYVYSGDFAGVVKKLDGNLLPSDPLFVKWSHTIGTNYSVYALAVDYSAGRLYAGTGFAYDAVYSIVTLNGNTTKIYTCPYGDVAGIAVDELSPTSIYFGTNTGCLLKISTAGFLYNKYAGWGIDPPAGVSTAVYNVRVGHDGYGYCATGPSGTYGKALYKFTLSTGNRVWHYVPSGTACAIGCAVDQFGNVYGSWYIAGDSVYNVVRKVNSAGVLQWSWQPYTSAQFRGLAVSPGIKAAGM